MLFRWLLFIPSQHHNLIGIWHGSEIQNKQKAYTGNGYRQKENAGRVIAIATDEETANFVYTQAIQSLPSPNGASIFTKISRCSHTAHSYAGVSFPWWPFLRRHLSFCHKSNFDSLSFCMWKKDSRQGSSNKYQKTFWALYVICKSRWYTPNSFDKTKIANLTFFTLVFPCKHFSSYNIWFTHIKVICVLRLVHAHVVGTQQFLL